MDTASESPQEPPRGRPLFDIGLQWLPSDVTEEDFARIWQSIQETLTPDYLEYLNAAVSKASKLRYEEAPPAKIAGAMFDGFVGALVRIGPDVRTQLVILAIIERHLKRVFLDSIDPLDFDGANRSEHKADALETSGGWALETALSRKLGERGLKLKPAVLAQQCAASLPNIRREWEVIVRKEGWFLRFQQPTPVEGPRSRTHLPEAAHFAAAAVLLEFEQLRKERGVTEYDVLDERYPDLEGAHLKTMGKAAEILYTARCAAAEAQFGKGSLSTLADPIAEDVVDDLCQLPLPIKPFLDLERSRRLAPDNEPDLRFDLRFLTRGALAGNQQFRNVVRQWAEPTLLKLVAECRAAAGARQEQAVPPSVRSIPAEDSTDREPAAAGTRPCPSDWVPEKHELLERYLQTQKQRGGIRVTLARIAKAVGINDAGEIHRWRKGRHRAHHEKIDDLEALLRSDMSPSEWEKKERRVT